VYRSSDTLLSEETQQSHDILDGLNVADNQRGWYTAALFSTSVVALTVWAATKFGVSGGIGTIQQGPCNIIKKTGLWLHIAINILSTALLGASNYCMQCLCSPTRLEVESAHARKIWLDIGIQSFRNLKRVSRGRMILWLTLAASSIPLHLM